MGCGASAKAEAKYTVTTPRVVKAGMETPPTTSPNTTPRERATRDVADEDPREAPALAAEWVKGRERAAPDAPSPKSGLKSGTSGLNPAPSPKAPAKPQASPAKQVARGPGVKPSGRTWTGGPPPAISVPTAAPGPRVEESDPTAGPKGPTPKAVAFAASPSKPSKDSKTSESGFSLLPPPLAGEASKPFIPLGLADAPAQVKARMPATTVLGEEAPVYKAPPPKNLVLGSHPSRPLPAELFDLAKLELHEDLLPKGYMPLPKRSRKGLRERQSREIAEEPTGGQTVQRFAQSYREPTSPPTTASSGDVL